MNDLSFMRLVLVVPMNGDLSDCFRVWEQSTDDGTVEIYTVTDRGNNPLHVTPRAYEAFNHAFQAAGWGVRVRKATERYYA